MRLNEADLTVSKPPLSALIPDSFFCAPSVPSLPSSLQPNTQVFGNSPVWGEVITGNNLPFLGIYFPLFTTSASKPRRCRPVTAASISKMTRTSDSSSFQNFDVCNVYLNADFHRISPPQNLTSAFRLDSSGFFDSFDPPRVSLPSVPPPAGHPRPSAIC